jgi:hypothetical protein
VIATVSPGTTFAGYRVEALIGRGGMGVVYRATDLSLERPVALKLIAPEHAQDERFRARFLREPRLAASLDHPSVVPIYDAGERDGQLYLAMRYVEGRDLKTMLAREGRLLPERALFVLAQVGGALDAAHRRGLVHRDVKPANVLLDDDGHAYLTDFGITKQLGVVATGTDTGSSGVVGTLDYLAPEQIRGESVDARTDCYALGCVLFECLAGAPPFRRNTEAETLWAHMQEEPPALAGHQTFAPVLRKALAKERDGRYGTCAELIEAAAPALGVGAPASARRRASRGTLLLVGGALLLGAATVLALTQALQDDASTSGGLELDVATNQAAAVDSKTGELVLAAPLPGRPTDIAAAGGTAWIATVDSTAVTGVSARTGSIARTVPLGGSADAIAVGGGAVWVADGRRAVLSRIEPGYEGVAQRIRLPRSSRPEQPSRRLRATRAALAVGGNAVWLTNGSADLMRIDPETGQVTVVPVDRDLDGVAAGAGAVWGMSSRSATVMRVNPRTGSVTDRIAITPRPGAEAPAPIAIAATSRAVWVLNGNTASVTQIDPANLGVVTTTPIGVDRVPLDLAAAGGAAWIANGDGSISEVKAGAGAARSIWVGESLERVAVDGGRVWATTTAFDQKLPGGAG